jgi:hypothetical protein
VKKNKYWSGTATTIVCVTMALIGFLSGMNHYLLTHTINPYEAKSKGITLVIPNDEVNAKLWHEKYDVVVKELGLKVYTTDGKLVTEQ